MIPEHITETLDWLLKTEDYSTVRTLAQSVAKLMNPDHPVATDFIAGYLQKSKHYREALPWAEKTTRLLPDSAGAFFNLGKCLNSNAKPAEAEQAMLRALKLDPDWIEAKIELSVFRSFQGRWDEAKQELEQHMRTIPEHNKNRDVVRFNLGWHLMREGQFLKGMECLSIGRKLNIWGKKFPFPESKLLAPYHNLRGKTVLLVGEAGYGDEMISFRFCKTVRDRGGRAVFVTRPELLNLFRSAGLADAVITQSEAATLPFDFWGPGMDLPLLLGLDFSQLLPEPYLNAPASSVQKWQHRLGPRNKRWRVGLRWEGNPLYEQDLLRSVPFTIISELVARHSQEVEFYSLQKDTGLDKLTGHAAAIIDLSQELNTWDDTAGVIQHLDLVISSCTAVPHLAAAMGKPSWFIIPLNPYYTWALPGSTTPWYHSARLIRQTSFNSWDDAKLELFKMFGHLTSKELIPKLDLGL